MNDSIITGRRRLSLILALFLIGSVDPALAAQPASFDHILRLESVSILPDDPGTVALVRRHLSLAAGAPVDVASLSLARQTLEETGYFHEVDLYTARGAAPGMVVLHIEVELDRRLHFLTGYGYQPLDGWYLNLLGARLLNRPRSGSELRLAWRHGFIIKGLYLEGSTPTAGPAGNAWRFELHGATKSWFVYQGREAWRQDIEQSALRVGRQTPLGAGGLVTSWIGISHADPADELRAFFDEEDQQRPADELIPATFEEHDYLDLLIEGHWQNRNQVRPWWRGTWAGARLRASHESGGAGFFTMELDGRHNWPVGDTASLAGRLRGAHATDNTPYHQRFQFGGVYSVRGYDFAYLSGPLGASSLVQANLEYRVALLDREAALPRVTALVFLDTGQAWDHGGGSFGWVVGAGYGVRVRLPWVQSLGLDVGYPVVDLGDISPFVINLGLGWSY